MKVMCTFSEPSSLRILGIGLNRITKSESEYKFEVIFQKGVGIALIQNVLETLRSELEENVEGTSIIPLEHFSIFTNYFKSKTGEKILLLYIYEKENNDIYSELYLHSRKIKSFILSGISISELIQMCNNSIDIPQTNGVKGVYVLASSGIPLFSKTDKSIVNLADSQLVGGLITALFNFSQHLIGKDSGGQLKEINFGNQSFYTISKDKVIFVYLVEKMTPLVERYMYILVDEFLGRYSRLVEKFDGNIAPFGAFTENIDQYLII